MEIMVTLEVIDYLELNEIFPCKTYQPIIIWGIILTLGIIQILLFFIMIKNFLMKKIIHNPNIEYIIVWKRDIDRIGESMKYF